MTNIILNWSPDDLINVGIVFGFLLGFICYMLCHIGDVFLKYVDEKKQKREDSKK